jgi:hypothetical protein
MVRKNRKKLITPDPDPESLEMLDPESLKILDPDPDPDPQHCTVRTRMLAPLKRIYRYQRTWLAKRDDYTS